MVLSEINAASIAVFEFEGDAPRSIDVNRIAPRIEPLQGMKVEARNVNLLGSDRNIETNKPRKNACMHFASIFELLPLFQSSERGLLLKVRITTERKQSAYFCQ